MPEQVHLERDGAIATVILNQPDRFNAMNKGMFQGLTRVFSECNADTSLRCVIIRGEGGKAFSAGADISEFETERSSSEKARAYAVHFHAGANAVGNCIHPVIAQIDGACIGGGLAVATLCDYRICGQSSRFGVPVKRLGLVEAHAEMAPLVHKFGANIALEILLLGNVFGVQDALRMGLVNRVVEDDQVGSEARATAEKIAEGAPLSARWHKKFIYRLLDPTPLSDAEIDEGFDCYDTEDFQIGYKAFLDKTNPSFKGR
jgi:enoyl-CoA hydratase